MNDDIYAIVYDDDKPLCRCTIDDDGRLRVLVMYNQTVDV